MVIKINKLFIKKPLTFFLKYGIFITESRKQTTKPRGTTYNTIAGPELEKQIARAAEHNNVSVEQIRSELNEGKRVLTGEQSPNYYYDHGMAAIRARPAPRSRPARKRLTCRSCGQSGYSGSYPFSTCASSGYCDDCF
jgi:hypothetical protein